MSAVLKAFNVEINNHALRNKRLPTQLKVLNWGKNETNDGDVYLNELSVEVFEANQRKAGRDKAIALDFDHCTVKGSKEYVAGQPKAIAAYGDPVIVKGDGLYLYNIEWTDLGEKYAKNYKDLSPAAVIDKTGVLLGLDSVALTPHGAVRDLNFFSAGGFDVDMIKNMSVGDRGASNPKPTSEGFVIKDADVDSKYNEGGANPAVKLGKSGPELKEMDAVDMGTMSVEDDKEALSKMKDLEEHEKGEIAEGDDHDKDCMCSTCSAHLGARDGWSPSEHSAHQAKVKEFSEDDHYSKYGDVPYADRENHKYPIDTEKHVRAAWSYINMPKNAKKEGDKVSAVKSRIKNASKKFGINIASEAKTKSMSADNPSFPDAYKAQPLQYNTMNDTIIKKMAAEVGMDGESDQEKVLFAFLAKYEGLKAEIEGQITHKSNTEDGGRKQFSADIDFLKKEVEELKKQKADNATRYDQTERDNLIRQAAREGKIVPLSADEVKTVDLGILKSIINNQPKNIVPMGSALRVLSVQGDNKPSREKSVAAFESMIVK